MSEKIEETIKVIGRISKGGKEYYQTAINDGTDEHKFIPVFLHKGLTQLNYKTMERKIDKRGVAYTLYEIPAKNVFFPEVKDEKDILKAIVMK